MMMYSDTLKWSDMTLTRDIVTELHHFAEFREVTMIDHLQRVWHADRGRLLPWTSDPFPFRTCIRSNVDTTLS